LNLARIKRELAHEPCLSAFAEPVSFQQEEPLGDADAIKPGSGDIKQVFVVCPVAWRIPFERAEKLRYLSGGFI
jgi:hypothetical protein